MKKKKTKRAKRMNKKNKIKKESSNGFYLPSHAVLYFGPKEK